MRRGDVVIADLDPASGAEASKVRPVVIVSNNVATGQAERLGRGVITVIPLTSNVSRLFSFQVMLPSKITGPRSDSKAQAEQVRAIDVRRCGAVVGHLPEEYLTSIDEALRLHLSL